MAAPDPLPQEQQVLSQSEVEKLLSQVSDEQGASAAATPDNPKHSKGVQPYDFRQPAFLAPAELRKLRLWHEEYIRALAARFSLYLRLEVNIQMSQLQTLTYQKFTECLANPTYITLFKAEPLRGVCILEMPVRMGLTIVDRLLGGPALAAAANRDMTEIEIALLDQALLVLLSEWCSHWNNVQQLRPVLLGHETNATFLDSASKDTIMLMLSMETRLGDCLEQIQLGFPYSMLEPLVLRMNQNLDAQIKDGMKPPNSTMRWHPNLDEVRIPITAEWNDIDLTVRQISNLKVGDVVPLSIDCMDHVSVRLANIHKFVGRLGTRGRCWAVETKQIVRNQSHASRP